jgi:hypothetical protein
VYGLASTTELCSVFSLFTLTKRKQGTSPPHCRQMPQAALLALLAGGLSLLWFNRVL